MSVFHCVQYYVLMPKFPCIIQGFIFIYIIYNIV